MMNVKNRFCQVSGVKVHLRQGGQGRPILFLHGAGGVMGWTPFFQQLATGAQVWAPDHPGFGQSDDPAWIKHMPDLAMFYLDFLDQLAPEQGFDVVGHSSGGWLAAEIAVRHGVEVIYVSNHGGRQLDGTISGLRSLAEIARDAGGMTVMYDGGIRRGSDVLKALALGASFVFVGRPMLSAAAVAGEEGVKHAIGLLSEEIDRNMAMMGIQNPSEMSMEYMRPMR
jgi:pimeloyl-ACP methyl ester carboxylesterase